MTFAVSLTEVRNALRCPRIFALGRAQRRPVGFPVAASSFGAAFHRVVGAFAAQIRTLPPALAGLDGAADEETIAAAITAVLLDGAVAEIERNPGYAAMPSQVDEFAEALRELAQYFARELKFAGGQPAEALARLVSMSELEISHSFELGNGETVLLNGRLDALQAPGTGAFDLLEYELAADDLLDRAQVALSRQLLMARAIDAEPVLLRFQPKLAVTRLARGEASALMHERLLPLLRDMVEWVRDAARAPGPEQADLCASCPVRSACAVAFPAYLACRDQPPASAARPLPDAKGEALLPASPIKLSAAQADDRLGDEEAEEFRLAVERIYLGQGVPVSVGEVKVGPRLVSLEVRAQRGPGRHVDDGASDVVRRLEGEFGVHGSYVRTAGLRRFEVARRTPRPVLLTGVLDRAEAYLQPRAGRFVLGEDSAGALMCGDLAEPASCHLLVASTPGSGKATLLRTLVASLAHYHGPDAIRFTLVDPKRGTFARFGNALAAHLVRPVCFEHGDALEILEGLVHELEERYQLFEQAGAEDLDSYNEAASGPGLARHVIVVTEYAGLVVSKSLRESFLSSVQRLCARSRGAGLHLVLATERPEAKTIPGVIKTNLVGRIALKLPDAPTSRLVIGRLGAEHLLGRGDLYADFGAGPRRAQAAMLGV